VGPPYPITDLPLLELVAKPKTPAPRTICTSDIEPSRLYLGPVTDSFLPVQYASCGQHFRGTRTMNESTTIKLGWKNGLACPTWLC
jgi:hypothetical protein